MKTPWRSIGAILTVSFFLQLSGCVSPVKTQQRIATPLVALDYNDISATYATRPTFVSAMILEDGSRVLQVQVDTYGANQKFAAYRQSYILEFVDAIDKFVKWNDEAIKNGDMFDKDIAKIPYDSGFDLAFVFHSGNKSSHYLVFEICGNLGIRVPLFALDKDNALVLRQLLVDLPNMKIEDTSKNYN